MDSSSARPLIILGTIAAAGLAGIVVAWVLPSRTMNTATPDLPMVSEIILAARSGSSTPENIRINQKQTYAQGEPLLLRVTTTNVVDQPYTISARLRTSRQTIQQLTPSTITMQPGVSTFCCWTIDTDGDYTLQLFFPDRKVTNIPININKGEYTGSGTSQLK